jgi:hypothetical protein
VFFYRDNLIEHLQQEISRLRAEIQRLIHDHQRTVDRLNEKIGELQVDLATKVFSDLVICIIKSYVSICIKFL